MASKEPLVAGPAPAESTPLVPTKGGEEDEPTSGMAYNLKVTGALGTLIAIVVLKVQMTSMLFSTANYPTAYSLWSCIVTCLMLVPVFLLYPSKWAVPTKEMFLGPSYALTLIIVFLCADMGFTNSAIAELNLALQQCIAATVPFWTVIIESLKNNKWQHPLIYMVVSVVVVGTVLTVMGQMEPPSTWGLVAAVLAVLSSASKSVFTHAAFMQYKKQLPSMAMLFWLDVLMAPIFIVWSLSNGELQALLTSGMDLTAWMQFTLTAALGGVRALAGFFLLILTSPTSNAIGNVITQQINIILAATVTANTGFNPMLTTGLALTMVFAAIYVWLKNDKAACGGIMLPKKSAEPSAPAP